MYMRKCGWYEHRRYFFCSYVWTHKTVLVICTDLAPSVMMATVDCLSPLTLRMTGGHNSMDPNSGICVTGGGNSEVKKWTPGVMKKEGLEGTWYTMGGQIGAPQSGCCWEHPDKPGLGNIDRTVHPGNW